MWNHLFDCLFHVKNLKMLIDVISLFSFCFCFLPFSSLDIFYLGRLSNFSLDLE
jgi:hypothetical protein